MQRASYFIMLLFTGTALPKGSASPAMTVIFVIDQFSTQYLEKLRPFLTGGIALLSEKGIEYTNALYDASPPSTAHNHTLLTTGTYGALHGIIANSWRARDLSVVRCDDDSAEDAAVFAPDGGLYNYGKSARNLLVDNLSDQLMLNSYPHARNNVWSLSMKSRAAILMGGHLAPSVWLDDDTRQYTSSKAYFTKIPKWVTAVNKRLALATQKKVTWKPFYHLDSPLYAFDDTSHYDVSTIQKPFINKTQDLSQDQAFKDGYERMPQATADLLTVARACIDANYKKGEHERFILWLNIASLDKVGHNFGPYSKEALDTIYHIDHQIGVFIKALYTKVPQKDVLFVLTGDHGVQPIPEILSHKGYRGARRYQAFTIIKELNKLVEKEHSITELVQFFSAPQFFLDMSRLNHLNGAQKQAVMDTMKSYLVSLPGVRNAWTFDELRKTVFEEYDLDHFIKKEIYPGRSGHLFYSTDPYTALYKGTRSALHGTQYAYDTRVPLIFYQAGRFPPRKIHTTRFMTQVAPTLAALLNVPRPSAALATVLPELVP